MEKIPTAEHNDSPENEERPTKYHADAAFSLGGEYTSKNFNIAENREVEKGLYQLTLSTKEKLIEPEHQATPHVPSTEQETVYRASKPPMWDTNKPEKEEGSIEEENRSPVSQPAGESASRGLHNEVPQPKGFFSTIAAFFSGRRQRRIEKNNNFLFEIEQVQKIEGQIKQVIDTYVPNNVLPRDKTYQHTIRFIPKFYALESPAVTYLYMPLKNFIESSEGHGVKEKIENILKESTPSFWSKYEVEIGMVNISGRRR